MTDELLVPNQLTSLTEQEAGQALKQGWFAVFSSYPTLDQLSLLWAQSALETGRWKYLHNYNFGNIKAIPGQVYCQFRCDEYINGHHVWFNPPDPATSFCSYLTAEAGAESYIRFLAQKHGYTMAWQQVLAGNPETYCHALKMAHYYTADEADYAKGVVSLVSEFKNKYANLLEDS